MPNYVVKTAAACMPGSCWGVYRRVAVLEVEDGLSAEDIKMISPRARGVCRVVETWERRSVGRLARTHIRTLRAVGGDPTDVLTGEERCAFSAAVREAFALVDRLSAEANRSAEANAVALAVADSHVPGGAK